MKIKVQTRIVWGRKLHYPMCPLSELLAKIGKRDQQVYTITDKFLKRLVELGFTVEQIPQFTNEEKNA